MTHPPTDGRRRRGERARAHILEHSTTLASTVGLDGISIGRVATDAGVSKGNIQVAFGDREALQLATLEKAVSLFETTVVQPALALICPADRLRAMVAGWFDFVEARILPGGCFVSAVSSEYRTRPGKIRDRIHAHRRLNRKRLFSLAEEARQAGAFSPAVDIGQMVFEIAAFQALANVAALMGDREDFDRARHSSLARIEAALAPVSLGECKT